MDARVSAAALLPLLAATLGGPARAADARIWVEEGTHPGRAVFAAELLGHVQPQLHPLSELVDSVQVVGVIDRRIEDLCGGPVDLDDWRVRLDQGRGQVQLLDLSSALATFGILDAELPCLTRLVAPQDVVRFHLSKVELHLLVAQSRQDQPADVAFHQDEARFAARRAVTAGPDLPLPDDTLPEAAALVEAVRQAQLDAPRARVVVAGDARRVFDNGRPAAGAVDVIPGTHVFQLTDAGGEQVIAVQLADLAPGSAAVVWARPDAAPMTRAELEAAVQTLETDGRAPVGLAPSLQALSSDGPAYVLTREGDRVRMWGADGDRVVLRIVDPPVGLSTAQDPQDEGVSGDVAMSLGGVGKVVGPGLDPAVGVEVGGRFGLHPMLALTLSVDVAAVAAPLLEDWTDTGLVSGHGGLRWRLPSRLWDVGVEGGAMLVVGDGGGDLLPSVRGVTSLRLPPVSLVGLRVGAFGGWLGPDGWQVGAGLSVDLLRDPVED